MSSDRCCADEGDFYVVKIGQGVQVNTDNVSGQDVDFIRKIIREEVERAMRLALRGVEDEVGSEIDVEIQIEEEL